MSETILEAIESAVPGLTEGDRLNGPPAWVKTMREATEVWLGGFTLDHVEVAAVRRDGNLDLEKLVISVITDEGVAAQAIVTIESGRDDGRGRFAGWAIVRLRSITGLTWSRHKVNPREVDQLTATFLGLPEPIVVPAEIDYNSDPDRFTKVFRLLRDAWIDSGTADRAADESRAT